MKYLTYLRAIGVGIVVLLAVLLATLGNGTVRQTAPAASPATVANSVRGSDAATPLVGVGSVPILLAPADGTRPTSLDTPVTFAWQPVSDPSASYNLEFQYSHDGSTWFKPEIVYGIIGTSYQRRNRFLEYGFARWRVWATTYSGDRDRSDWRQMPLPPQTGG